MIFAFTEFYDIKIEPFRYTILIGKSMIIGAPDDPAPFIEENITHE